MSHPRVKINVRRLLQLACLLRTVPAKEFNLEKPSGELKCTSTACAVGHALLHKPFIKEGLHAEPSGLKHGTLHPKFDGAGGWSAVSKFFGLSQEQAEHLFSVAQYFEGGAAHPEHVANRIEKFVRENTRFRYLRAGVDVIRENDLCKPRRTLATDVFYAIPSWAVGVLAGNGNVQHLVFKRQTR